jgi:hypothetical protein
MSKSLIPTERIEQSILLIRGQKVILDVDLAQLYGVTTKRLNEQVKRNVDKFPDDFMFQLTRQETAELVANCDRFKNLKHSTSLPYAFTEHGAIMAATILNSKTATKVSIHVVRAFVKLREMLKSHAELAQKIGELERCMVTHDKAIRSLFDAIKKLMEPPKIRSNKIGFELGIEEV